VSGGETRLLDCAPTMTRRMRPLRSAILASILCTALGAGAQASVPFWGDKASQPADVPVEQLKPGQFVWDPAAAPEGPIVVVVSLDSQRAHVYRNGVEIGYAAVSTGRKGYVTPTGVFITLQKDKDHHSSVYNDAAMPYTQRLTWGGVALHAGGLPGYPSSHGCVHLPSAFAQLLFDQSPLGMTVVIADAKASPVDVDAPAMLSPVNAASGAEDVEARLAAGQDFRWEPEKAPAGPVSLLISRADQRALVLRGGIEIGRSRISIDQPERPFGTHVFTVKQPGPGESSGIRWLAIGIPGHANEAGLPMTPEQHQRVRIPPKFLALVQPILAPGSTLLVTDQAILPSTSGVPMTVVTNSPVGEPAPTDPKGR